MNLAHNSEGSATRYQTRSFIMGVAQIVLGIIAISFSSVTTFLTITLLGYLIIFRGVIDLFHSFPSRKDEGFWWRLLGSVLSIVVGALIISTPAIPVLALTLMLGVLFITNGLYKAIAATIIRFPHWGWVVFSGLVSIVVGGMVLTRWPLVGFWFIGLLVGIEILVHGFSLVMYSVMGSELGAQNAKGSPSYRGT